jgi:aryl-alcohol dehydrogenase
VAYPLNPEKPRRKTLTATLIRAAVLKSFKEPLEIRELTIGNPRPDELRVRMVATGICHTDIIMLGGLLRAPLPAVLGHEGAGVVEAIGSAVTTHKPGDHVVLSFAHCGHCSNCNEGKPSYCQEFMPRNFTCARTDGSSAFEGTPVVRSHFFGQSSFASQVLCGAQNAIIVPKDAPLELLGPLGCGVQTGAGAVLNALKVRAGASIAVLGAGAVGMSAVMAARVAGATNIVALDKSASRLQLAMEIGATGAVQADHEDSASKLKQLSPAGFDFTLDTTGVPAVIDTAIAVLARRGICGLLSGAPSDIARLPVNQIFSNGQTIRGITEGDSNPATFIPELIRLRAQGRFPFDRIVKYFPFDEINAAITGSMNGTVVKPIVRF